MTMATTMTPDAIRAGLSRLQPATPWAHHFDLGNGIETVSPEVGQFYRKAMGLKAFGALFPSVLRGFMQRKDFGGMKCLDLGCAEGMHSITMAEGGAAHVLGLEGRQLYVDRARFIAEAKGLQNIEFRQADVRDLDKNKLGQFDFVLCSGLLHHLNREVFMSFTQSLYDLTGDTLLLYTHVSSEWVIKKFKLQPAEPIEAKYDGALFREHADDATEAQRTAQVRASLDNTFSFWATEPALMQRFHDLGFKTIMKLYEPAFALTFQERVFRGVWVLRRNPL